MYENSCKMSGSKTPRIELSLQKKIELIKSKKSCRNLAADFNISKWQVQRILKRKSEFIAAYEANQPDDRKRIKLDSRYGDIDLLNWCVSEDKE